MALADLSGVRSAYQPVITLTSQGPEPVKGPDLPKQHDMSCPPLSTRLSIRIIPQPSGALTAGEHPPRHTAEADTRTGCRTGNRLTVFMRAIKAVAMTSHISHTSFDARNAYAQSVFWSQVLDFAEDPDDPNEPGHEECLITSRDLSQLLLFITVPDNKKVKNRVHLDLRPVDGTREQEVERILALGASQLADHRRPDGSGWITLADPEGNEFCILSKDPAGSGATT
jgi:predicted enzyme related to lactoylglutathione lyase